MFEKKMTPLSLSWSLSITEYMVGTVGFLQLRVDQNFMTVTSKTLISYSSLGSSWHLKIPTWMVADYSWKQSSNSMIFLFQHAMLMTP